MSKRVRPRRMYDMAGERSVTNLLRATQLKKELSSISKPAEDSATASKEPEQASSSKFPEEFSTSLLSGQDGTSKSSRKQAETGISRAEEKRLMKLKRLRKDSPKLKLFKFINVGNLFSIGHNHPEFRPLIINMFQAHEFVDRRWDQFQQKSLMRLFVKLETDMNELVSLKNNPDPSSDDIEERLDILNFHISQFTVALQLYIGKHEENSPCGAYIPDETVSDYLEQREKTDIDEYRVKPETYLSTSIDTEYLIRIAHEHSELRPSVKCTLNIISAMNYLDYEGQVKVYKILLKVVGYVRKMVHQKYHPDLPSGGNIDETTNDLISSIFESFTEIMSNLTEQCKKSRKKAIECLSCLQVKSFVKDVKVKPQQWSIQENPRRNLKGVIAYANRGISQEYLKNLESLFHHLAAKKGAFRHVWLYKDCVNWLEIAAQYGEYRSKACESLEKMNIIRSHFMRRFDEFEEIMAEATEFSERLGGISYAFPDNLSDVIALGGEMELLASEAESYLKTLYRLIRDFLDDSERFTTLNKDMRRSRYLFLTEQQFFAFEFPLY